MTNRNSMQIGMTDSPSFTILECVSTAIQDRTIGGIRKAVKDNMSYVDNEVVIGRPNSMYDCTGKSFTSDLKMINRFINYSEGKYWLTTVHVHQVSVDV